MVRRRHSCSGQQQGKEPGGLAAMCPGSIPGPTEAPRRAGFCSHTLEDGLTSRLSSCWCPKPSPPRPCCGLWSSATDPGTAVSGERRPRWVAVSVYGVQGQASGIGECSCRKGPQWVWLSLSPRLPAIMMADVWPDERTRAGPCFPGCGR